MQVLGDNAADHYRRVYSKDSLEFGTNSPHRQQFPKSADGPTEYKPRETLDILGFADGVIRKAFEVNSAKLRREE